MPKHLATSSTFKRTIPATAAICLSMWSVLGCTAGEVTDAATNAKIPGATLVYESLDVNQPVVSATAPATLHPNATLHTWTTAQLTATGSSTAYAGTFWADPYATVGPATKSVTQGWNRITLSASGYDSIYVYRNHQYVVGGVSTNLPGMSGSNFTVPPTTSLNLVTTSGGGPTWTTVELFQMYSAIITIPPICILGSCVTFPTLNDHVTLPDLIVDIRSLLPTAAGATTPSPQQVGIGRVPIGQSEGYPCDTDTPGSALPDSTAECLAFPLNVANVGTGNFELLSDTSSLNTVKQVIYSASGTHIVTPTTGSMVRTSPGGFHVSNLVEMRLRGPIVGGCTLASPTPGCCDTAPTADTCPIVTSAPKAICMEGHTPFDQQILQKFGTKKTAANLNGGDLASCQAYELINGTLVLTPDTGRIDSGLLPGTSELYAIGNPYNYLDIDGLAPGAYWLEAEINPVGANGSRVYQESDTTNNIARAAISITSQTGGGFPPQR